MRIPQFWDVSWQQTSRQRRTLNVLALVNLVFAAASIFFWNAVSQIVADPMSWATWRAIGTIGHRPDLFEYPFLLIWGLPVVAAVLAYFNYSFGLRKLASVIALFPLVLMTVTVLWWYAFKDVSI